MAEISSLFSGFGSGVAKLLALRCELSPQQGLRCCRDTEQQGRGGFVALFLERELKSATAVRPMGNVVLLGASNPPSGNDRTCLYFLGVLRRGTISCSLSKFHQKESVLSVPRWDHHAGKKSNAKWDKLISHHANIHNCSSCRY